MLRCDSPETASLLLAQLNRLIEKPDNQKKFQEIENRLQVKKQKKSALGEQSQFRLRVNRIKNQLQLSVLQ